MEEYLVLHIGKLEKKPDSRTVLWVLLVILLTFQSALQKLWQPLSFIDEAVALVGLLCAAYGIVVEKRKILSGSVLPLLVCLGVFVISGLLGSVLYRYQSWKSVIIDLYTNLKFFFAIGTGYFLFRDAEWDQLKQAGLISVKIIVAMLFALFLLDRIFVLYPMEYRYGIRSAILIFEHSTYLAGAMAFLVVLLTVFYEKQNIPFLAMALIMIVFTLRSKAIASAAAYAVMFLLFIRFRLKIRLSYAAAIGAACILLGWPKIQYYFLDLSGGSARSIFLRTAFQIMKDYFPIGTGFAAYGSAEAAKHYSPVYYQYGFQYRWDVRDVSDVENSLQRIASDYWLTKYYEEDPSFVYRPAFLNDHFWPTIFGQTGVIGTIAFVLALGILIWWCLKIRKTDLHASVGVLYIWVYLLVSSIAEPAFHNAISIPLALVMGMVFGKLETENTGSRLENNTGP